MKKIIDIHCHTAGAGFGGSGCTVSPALRNSWRYRIYLKAFNVTPEELERHGDVLVLQRLSALLAKSREVAGAVVLAMDAAVTPEGAVDSAHTEVQVPTEFVLRETKQLPNLFVAAGIHPYRRDWEARLEQAASQGALLVKWLPSIQHMDPADRRIIPFYRKLAELRLPLLTHTGDEHSFTYAQNELADPQRLELPLAEGVTVIAAHAAGNGKNGGEDNFSRLVRLMERHHNLYADISSLTQINRHGQLRRALRHPAFRGRLLYGSDMPLINTPLVTPWQYLYLLGPVKTLRIARIANIWDRDVALKRALGVPEEVFTAASAILPLPAEGASR